MGLLTFFGFDSHKKIKEKLINGDQLSKITKSIKKERNDFNRDFKKIKSNKNEF